MKSLRAFWHWVDNERPCEVLDKHIEPLTDAEQRSLGVACQLLFERLDGDLDYARDLLCDVVAVNALRGHWTALRELSFALCPAIQAMHEAVRQPAWVTAPFANVRVVTSEVVPPGRVAAFDVRAAMQQAIQNGGVVQLPPGRLYGIDLSKDAPTEMQRLAERVNAQNQNVMAAAIANGQRLMNEQMMLDRCPGCGTRSNEFCPGDCPRLLQ